MTLVLLENAKTQDSGTTDAEGVLLPVDIHDRVAEAYFGKLGERFMRETQQRIHWICGKVQGQRVLDVGCSQGVAAILLGREGKQVTGVDAAQRSIEQAQGYLEMESPRVRSNVRFVTGDFLAQEFGEAAFDTVIVAEVLEHLLQPETFIDAAARNLPPDGRLIVTVPFGINDFIDHKRTYYLLEPYRLLSRHFEVVEVAMLGKWLGLVGRRRAAKEKAPSSEVLDAELVQRLEGAFLELEREIRDEATLARSRLNDANLKYRTATEQIATLKQRVAQEEQAHKQGESKLAQLQQQLSQAEQAREKTRADLNDANLKYRAATEQIATLKQRVADQEQARNRGDEAIREAQNRIAELAGAREALEKHVAALTIQLAVAERDQAHLSTQLASVREELVSARAAAAESDKSVARLSLQIALVEQSAETRLARLEAEHDEVTARLDEANRKYRAATDQVASLGQRVQEAEAASLAHKTTLSDQLAAARRIQEDSAKLIGELQSQVRDGEETINTLREQLTAAEHDRKANLTDLDRAVSELDTVRALSRSEQHQNEQLKRQFLQTKKALAELQGKVEALRQQKIAAENQVAKTRAMLSFQLGYRLLHGFKSFRAFMQLPGQLLALRKEAKRRKISRGTKEIVHRPATPAIGKPASASMVPAVHAAHAPASISLPDAGFASALKALRVACIMDEFTFSSYQPECNLLQLSVQHWRTELESFSPELLFIESAWRGKDDQWGSKVGHMSEEVVGIVAWCRERKIPTVFWNKEDPVHFETFLSTAKMFDYVFTTDIDCIHRYKAALGHDRVYLLPFACQPAASNPIEKYERKDAFCFAGAYYVRYPERTRDLGNFMASLSEYRPVEIYDRNYGKNDPNYQFPPEYQPFIVGNLPFDQIDKAYKGYRYAINLNSIKQSQSMFARRVFELLASNTVTVSNFSRGVRLMFGDLVVTTDDGGEIVRRLQTLGGDDATLRKFRLAGLRKVMMNHTYQDRLAYIASKVQGKAVPNLLPRVVVTAYAKNQEQFDGLLATFERQSHRDTRLVLVVPAGFAPGAAPDDDRVLVLPANAIDELTLGDVTAGVELVAGMVPDDYYGPNYLLDLVLATRYTEAEAIGKLTHHVWSTTTGLGTAYPGCQYSAANALPARCALVRPERISVVTLREWVTSLYTRSIDGGSLLSIDEFNYCKNGNSSGFDAEQVTAVNDLAGLDLGVTAEELVARAERIAPGQAAPDESPVLSGADLAAYFKPVSNEGYTLAVSGSAWEAESTLPDGKHEYLYAATDLRPSELGFDTHAQFHLDATPGLNLQLVMLFLDAQKQRISHVVKSANRNQEAAIPAGTEWIRLGLRIYGGGAARINGFVLGHRPLRPAEVLGRAEHLVLTNHYPSYDDLYRNGFVHSRVKAYADRGVRVDVFRLRTNEALSYHEFHNVDVITGSQEALHKLLSGGHYKSVLVHFLDEGMWDVLKHHIQQLKVVVWLHGAEIQPWYRREYNYENDQQRESAKTQSATRTAFWRKLLTEMPENLKFVFVSEYFAQEVMDDYCVRLPDDRYSIIHNPIDTELFAYSQKSIEQRKKILSIRPYASHQYANDLSVKTILELSNKPYFKDLEFRLVGDGRLFNETLEPLRQFTNVCIEQRFLTRSEIASLHREYGVFLCPTRWDSQGVSRDEAMSSGLVPITCAIAAIPEFLDERCGILTPPEDVKAMADGISALYDDPKSFSSMSQRSAERVRAQSHATRIINAELSMFLDVK